MASAEYGGESAMLSPSQVRSRQRFSHAPRQLDPLTAMSARAPPPSSSSSRDPPSLQTHLANVEQASKVHYDDLLKRHRKLQLLYDNSEARLTDASQELKRLRQMSQGQEKELLYCKKTLEHVGQRKDELESINKEQGQYIKRLEGKMEIGAATSTLSARNRALQTRVGKLKRERNELQELSGAMENQIGILNSEISILRSAVNAKAPAATGGGTAGENLLYQVSKSQHENAVLGLEVARSVQEAKTLNEQLNKAATRIEELQIACERLHTENDSLQRKLEMQHGHSADMHRQVDQLGLEKQALLERITEEQGKRDDLNNEMNALLAEHQKRETRLTNEITEWTDRYHAVQDENARLQQRIEQVENGSNSLESALIQERTRLIQGKALIGKQNNIVRDLKAEVNALYADIDRLTEENLNLQSMLGDKDAETQELGEQVVSEQRAKNRLEDILASTDREHAKEVLHVSVEAEDNAMRLQSALDDRDVYSAELERVQHERDALQHECDRLREEIGGLKLSLDRVTNSKTLLQKTMLDQISAVRSQLSETQARCDRLSSRAETAENENRNLEILLAQTRRTTRPNVHFAASSVSDVYDDDDHDHIDTLSDLAAAAQD